MAGISTISISSIPDLTAAVGVPRLAAIEYPLGYLLGAPNDLEGQHEVLRRLFKILSDAKEPGKVSHLPLEWDSPADILDLDPPSPPPIVEHIKRHPLQIRNLYMRKIPSL
jgi:hypothetical protein